jgi:hypothetical protein
MRQRGDLEMKRYKKSVLAVPSSFIVICVISMFAISEERTTITGTVNEDYGLAADEGHISIVVEPEMVERLDEIIDDMGLQARLKKVKALR